MWATKFAVARARLTTVVRALRHLDLDTHDVCAVSGFGALVYGIAQLSRPDAWIAAGTLLLTVAAWPAFKRFRKG